MPSATAVHARDPRPRVVLIDDSILAIHVGSEVLTRAGMDVRVATTIADFDAQLDSWMPDIIVTDVNMPEMSGAELCRRLKSHAATAHVPVILFSSLGTDELRELAARCGADDFFSKRGTIDELAKRLRRFWDARCAGTPRRLADSGDHIPAVRRAEIDEVMETRARKILLLDDSELALELAREHLALAGFEVRTARALSEFDVVLRRWQPDIVLTDVNMPELSGADLCRAIKARSSSPVPVVLISSLPESELETLAQSAGADAYLSKRGGLDRMVEELGKLTESILW